MNRVSQQAVSQWETGDQDDDMHLHNDRDDRRSHRRQLMTDADERGTNIMTFVEFLSQSQE
jgi:hypothetical protein